MRRLTIPHVFADEAPLDPHVLTSPLAASSSLSQGVPDAPVRARVEVHPTLPPADDLCLRRALRRVLREPRPVPRVQGVRLLRVRRQGFPGGEGDARSRDS